jgi:hypothetical protein
LITIEFAGEEGGNCPELYRIERGGQRMVLRMPGARADAARVDGLLREIRLVRALWARTYRTPG